MRDTFTGQREKCPLTLVTSRALVALVSVESGGRGWLRVGYIGNEEQDSLVCPCSPARLDLKGSRNL